MKVKCNKIESCGVGYTCPHATPHEKVLTCSGKCLQLKDKAKCLPVNEEGRTKTGMGKE